MRAAEGEVVDGPVGRLVEPLSVVLGTRSANPLAKLGLRTTGELLRHYPRRYNPPGTLTDLSSLQIGEHVTVLAEVRQATVRPMRNSGFILSAVVTDGVRSLQLTFFAKRRNALGAHDSKLKPGRIGLFTGTVSAYQGNRQLTHPDYTIVGADADSQAEAVAAADRPIPIYPAGAAIPSWRIQTCVQTVLGPLAEADVPDPIPASVRTRHGLRTLYETLRDVHEPTDDSDWKRGQHRLKYEEAFVLQVALARRRAEASGQEATARAPRVGGLLDRFDAQLPFTLTRGQREVGAELAADLARANPMQRLLQGEVGSGKTVVALRAMLQVVDAGGQAALLAPTEVLASQHVRTLRALLGPLAEGGFLGGADDGTRVALLTGSQGAAARRENLLDAASGRAGIVVGTHALLSENVQFADLGLVVVDEQHRFGVEQRDLLRAKAASAPHLLVMTATPIPRTVAMTVFGDLETSTLREVPAGRSGVTTHVVPADKAAWMDRTWRRVREEVDAFHRVYVVCPRIEPDDAAVAGTAPRASGDEDGADLLALDLDGEGGTGRVRPPLRAVLEVVEELRSLPALAGVDIAVLHGRMSAADKEAAMAQFAAGQVQVLVSTTVIEVGVDVAEATVMVVLDADRFGISQLHQLRGRVGRGSAPGLCLLVSGAVDGDPTSLSARRLKTLEETTDGFVLASVDLDLRREGDVLGAAQSGAASSLRLLRVTRDAALIAQARDDATAVVGADPTLESMPALRAAIELQLAGEREEFLERS